MKKANVAFFIPHVGCPNRCSFCNQNTISGKNRVPSVDYIKETLDYAVASMDKNVLKSSEIAFFGGSFTAIDKKLMTELLACVQQYIGENGFYGIRVSTRPDAIDDEILSLLKKYRVTSIELGAQSMSDDVLLKNMRGHTASDVFNASNLIKTHGFSLGLQIMTGLYGDTADGAIETAKKFIEIKPDTVRIYPTVVLKDTYLAKLYAEGKYNPLNVEETVSLCAKLLNMFEENSIKVIRVGLHDQPSLKENFVAGAYHAALGELIMGEQMFLKALSALKEVKIENGEVRVAVNPSNLSQMIGQKKCNIKRFSDIGYKVSVKADSSVKIKDIKVI
ncbi:MAG: radical SAM protein [Oscillospiraceae bacterium]|nr:radical SAM protein [Oscillospiraceae bacterium]